MAKTVIQMVREAQAGVHGIDATEARQRLQDDPSMLVVEVRDAANRRTSGMVEGRSPFHRDRCLSPPTRKSLRLGVIPDCKTAPGL